jgi:GTPase SAR1 family protein
LRVFQLKSIEIPVLVVGNKVDLTRQVQEEEVQNIHTDWGCTYIGK